MARILAASRQLYRGTLDPEARAEADAQDVLSITKLKQQENDGTTDTALGRPAAVTNAFEKLDPALFNESLLKHSTPKQAGDSGQYPTGTSFATGGGLEAHTPRTKEYMDLKARGLASQSVIIYDAPELSYLQIARNNMLENNPSLSKNGAYSVDPNPDKNARVFGIAYPNGRNAPYQLYDLGSLPSNGRLNTNSNAMNKGIDAAGGEWLYFFGADDSFYRRDTLEVMIQNREISDDITLVLGNVIYPDGRLFRSRFDKKLYYKNCIHHQSAFYRRCVFDKFRYGHDEYSGFQRYFGISGDYQLNLMLFTRGARHLYRDEIVARCGRGVSMEGRFVGYREEIAIRHQYMNFYKAVFFDITTLLRYGWKQIYGTKDGAQ